MIFWIRLKEDSEDDKKKYIRIEEKWQNYFYIASDNKSKLRQLVQNNSISSLISSYEFVKKFETITDTKQSTILKLTTLGKKLKLTNMIETMNKDFRFYNVDLLPEQQYFFEHNIFPLGLFEITYDKSDLVWKSKNNDDIRSTNFFLPNFEKIHIKIKFTKGKMVKLTDEINSISIVHYQDNSKSYIIDISDKSEKKILQELIKVVQNIDPDFIYTDDGDSFIFPYLIYRAKINRIELFLSRDNNNRSLTNPKIKGNSFVSYGRTYFKPSTIRLFGRVHIDKSNSFTNRTGSDLEGLFEISRLCRMPLHEASRASIGRCLTSLHLYNATKKDLLIPWKPLLNEHPKNMVELFLADRGGLVLEPDIGVFEKVTEFDFVSLYPNIMLKRNVSAETVSCECCFDNHLFKVPELNYHICNKKGLIPESLEIVLKKRLRYKDLKNKTSDPVLKSIYDKRQSALKWILVTSFGYLGFSNAKFGRIDAHIAVCAFARSILSNTMHIVEDMGFEVLHGIIDSIWVKKKYNATKNDYFKLKDIIQNNTEFDISFEGIYKWIAFLPSKINFDLPVLNRYFGVFEDGTLKVRGIESRRHDIPQFLSQCQNEILELLAQGNSISEIKQNKIPLILKKVEEYLSLLKNRKVDPESLLFTKLLSKDYNKYDRKRNTLENDALIQLELNGEYLKAGQVLQYIIVDHNGYKTKRVLPFQLLEENKTNYDVKRYSKLLIDSCNTVLEPFGIVFDRNLQSLYRLDNYY